MKAILRLFMAISLLLAATSSYAFFGNNNDWGGYGGNWNPYDEWDPRYWMEEMEQEWDDDDDYYRGGRGYGPYGGGPGYGYGGGPGYGGYGPGYGGYGPGYGGGYAPYGYAPQPQYTQPQYTQPQYTQPQYTQPAPAAPAPQQPQYAPR
jgi:hypothetical protein